MNKNLFWCLLVFYIFPIWINAQEYSDDPGNDKTLSPYFYVKSDDPKIDALPLLSTSADVNISGVIADVTVHQVYKNSGNKPLEAVYTFPASTRAAVYSMTMKIGKRLLVAEIQERQKARETYEKAKQEGRSTSLLEQERPNVFQMNIANIMPGDTIEIEMKYTELLIPSDGIYEFVYPTVVGPRYSNKNSGFAKDDDKFVESPYTHEGTAPYYDFDISLKLNAGMALSEVFSPSHKVVINYQNDKKDEANISLDKGLNKSGNKDFVLDYRLAGNKIQTGLLLSKGDKEQFFLLMLQPPKKVKTEDIPPREYIFVVDVSGSMNGYPLDISKSMMKELLSSLSDKDLFNVLLFAGSSKFMNCQSVPATKENIDDAIRLIENEKGGGGTELLPALRQVHNNAKASGYSRSVIILTDGFVDIEKETFELIKDNLGQANVFPFGIGTSVNRFLIDGIARVGKGEPFYVLNPKKSDSVRAKFLKYIESPVLTDVKISFNGFNAYDVEPQNVPDIMEQRPIIIYGKFNGPAQGIITVNGRAAEHELHVDIPVKVFAGDESDNALKYLWARNKLAELSDYATLSEDSLNRANVTNIGLKYNLLTKYTSFVAVDYEIRNGTKEIVKVNQPLPLPEGVSDNALGESRGSRGTGYYMQSNALSPAPLLQKSITLSSGTADANALEPEIRSEKDLVEAKKEVLIHLNNEFRKYFVYPQKAIDKGIQGNVILWAMIDKTGKCIFTEFVETKSGTLFAAATDAIKKMKFNQDMNYLMNYYNWKKIEIDFKAIKRTAEIIQELDSYAMTENIKILDIKIGTGDVVSNGDKVTIRYSSTTSDCLKLEQNRIQTVLIGDSSINPAFNLILLGMKKGSIRNAVIPEAFFKPEHNELTASGKQISFEVEIIGLNEK